MFQPLAVENGAKLWVLDLQPDAYPNGTRRRQNDPPLPPQRVLMDFHVGADACERSPQRYRVDGMTDTDWEKLKERSQNR